MNRKSVKRFEQSNGLDTALDIKTYMFTYYCRLLVVLHGIAGAVTRAVANGPVGPAMAGPIIQPVIKKKNY